MNAHTLALGLTAFLACAVEAIEALTVVVAVGVTRGWARALIAALCALVVLAVVVALAGPRLPALAELRPVRLIVGLIALYLGSRWLRKAVLRAAGRKALRDERVAFERRPGEGRRRRRRRGVRDRLQRRAHRGDRGRPQSSSRSAAGRPKRSRPRPAAPSSPCS